MTDNIKNKIKILDHSDSAETVELNDGYFKVWRKTSLNKPKLDCPILEWQYRL